MNAEHPCSEIQDHLEELVCYYVAYRPAEDNLGPSPALRQFGRTDEEVRDYFRNHVRGCVACKEEYKAKVVEFATSCAIILERAAEGLTRRLGVKISSKKGKSSIEYHTQKTDEEVLGLLR